MDIENDKKNAEIDVDKDAQSPVLKDLDENVSSSAQIYEKNKTITSIHLWMILTRN